MAELTEGERKILYQHDLDIINRQADEKIAKLKAKHAGFDAKEQAKVDKLIAAKQALRDKRKAAIKAQWDQRLAAVKPGQEYKTDNINEQFDGLSDLADLAYENWFDDASESQYKKDGERKERQGLEIEAVEKWRNAEIAKEVSQLAAHTQRQRKE